jgi:hypothetical protein
MDRIIAQIELSSGSDLSHVLGQTLLSPVSFVFGHSYRLMNGDVNKLPDTSLLKKVIILALAAFFYPITLTAAGCGFLLLCISDTHRNAYEEVKKNKIEVIWNQGVPEIRTRQVKLRPVVMEDLPVYQNLFNNAVAMERYAGGPRDITARFHNWIERWKVHPFSALAVVDPESTKVIGHAVVGLGDYEGDLNKGNSEMALVIEPAYWNADYKDEARGIGTAGKKHIGSEVVRATVAYARALKERSILAPCSVSAEQLPELERSLLQNRRSVIRIHKDENGKIDWIYLPLTELRATARKDNSSHKILEKVFVRENGGIMQSKNNERDLFILKEAL